MDKFREEVEPSHLVGRELAPKSGIWRATPGRRSGSPNGQVPGGGRTIAFEGKDPQAAFPETATAPGRRSGAVALPWAPREEVPGPCKKRAINRGWGCCPRGFRPRKPPRGRSSGSTTGSGPDRPDRGRKERSARSAFAEKWPGVAATVSPKQPKSRCGQTDQATRRGTNSHMPF